jgi:hypothetical protein
MMDSPLGGVHLGAGITQDERKSQYALDEEI